MQHGRNWWKVCPTVDLFVLKKVTDKRKLALIVILI